MSSKIEELEERSELDPETGCWVWTGPVRRIRHLVYPRFGDKNKRYPVRSFVAGEFNGIPGPKRPVTMTCGNKLCVAPDHMVLTNRSSKKHKKNRDTRGPGKS